MTEPPEHRAARERTDAEQAALGPFASSSNPRNLVLVCGPAPDDHDCTASCCLGDDCGDVIPASAAVLEAARGLSGSDES